MERLGNLLHRAGRSAPERLAAATLEIIQAAIRSNLPEESEFLRAISLNRGTVRVRAKHSAAAGRLRIHAQTVLQQANSQLQKIFPGQPAVQSIQIIRR